MRPTAPAVTVKEMVCTDARTLPPNRRGPCRLERTPPMPRTIPIAFLSFSFCLLVLRSGERLILPRSRSISTTTSGRSSPPSATPATAPTATNAGPICGSISRRTPSRRSSSRATRREIALFQRIHGEVPDHLMPPPTAKTGPLSPDQIDTLRRWVDQGAKFERHWAYVPPVRPTVPDVKNKTWVRNPIDAFIAAGHECAGFQPAPEADRVTLRPPAQLRSDRPAAHAGRGGRLRQGRQPRRL